MNNKYFFIFFCITLSSSLFAHEQINLQISKINQQLILKPENENFLLKRASLYYAHSEFELALKDTKKVVKINKNNKNAWILKGGSLLKLYRHSEALDAANQAIKRWPTSSDSLLLRARVNAKLPGQVKTSIEGYNQVINQFKNPDPSLLIERADTQLSIGTKGFRPALEQLAHARTKYGFIYVAQNKALDIAKTAKQFDMALKIAKDINQHMSRHDKWLRIMGDILMLQTKNEEAKLKYSQALKSIESLSDRQKKHSKTTQRKNQLIKLLKELSPSSS